MEMTQMFYDGALKKLALDGQRPQDIRILTSIEPPTSTSTTAKENAAQREDNTSKKDTTPKKNVVPTEISTPEEKVPEESTSAGDIKSEETVSTSEQGETLGDKDKDSNGANTANVAGDASATGHGFVVEEAGFLGTSADENSNDNFEYSLWTFGDMRLLIRDRLHGFLVDQVSLS